jgi:long-chain acyl-CoA synthetase
VREFAVPESVSPPTSGNLSDLVFTNAADYGDHVCFDRKVDGSWQPVTCKDFAEQVRTLAAGLIAAGVGVGDRVALMSATRYEWTLIDFAIWTAGAVTVPVYETSSPEQVQWILSDSGAVGAFLETDAHQAAYDEISANVPSVRNVWRIPESLDPLVAAGTGVTESQIRERRAAVGPNDLATVIYTSGTTGQPKGCELTHSNFLFDAESTTYGLEELFSPDDSTLLFLPLAHVFARMIEVGCVMTRARLGHTADIRNLMADLKAFRPTFILSVPRVFEKVYNQAKQKAQADGHGMVFGLAESTAIGYSQAMDKGGPGLLLRAQHALFDRLVYSKLREALGGRVRYAVSGGAPLGDRLGHFFRGVGVTVLEGYGLTETTAGATLNRPDKMKVGTVGQPVPGVTVRIADDGEVLLKGGNIFRGYWHNDKATTETLDPDGWLHTGDVGELDDDGFLRITGRKKELIVTAGGKNVAPAVLEDRLRAHWLISQCIVVGDRRPFVGALVTIDAEAFPEWKRRAEKPADAGVSDLVADPDLRAEIQRAVDDANRAVSKAESVRAFTILPTDFSIESGELTPSMKVKRNVVNQRFADAIDLLYTKPGT